MKKCVLLYVWPGYRRSPGPHNYLLGGVLLVGNVSEFYDGNMENCTKMLHVF